MPIEYKTIERSNPQDRTKKKFYATAQKTGDTRMDELCDEIVQISALSKSDVYGVLYALLEVLPRHLGNGRSVHLEGLGSFRVSLRSNAEDSEDDVDMHSIKGARLLFTISKDLKKLLNDLEYRKVQ